jgi:hypothetical protein
MLRLGSRGCVLALLGVVGLSGVSGIGACKTDAGSGTLGSPNAAAAGNESAKPSSGVAGTSKSGSADGLARSLVAVAATSPGEAQPCERACGRVGDCLLESKDVGEFEAGRLELACLDACVHSPESDGPRSAFLACERQSSCGELLGCARSNWDALVAAHAGPTVQGITTGGDSCLDACQWLFSCMISGVPPSQAGLSGEYEETIRGCATNCEVLSPAEQEGYMRIRDCLHSNCGPDRHNMCYEMF